MQSTKFQYDKSVYLLSFGGVSLSNSMGKVQNMSEDVFVDKGVSLNFLSKTYANRNYATFWWSLAIVKLIIATFLYHIFVDDYSSFHL